MTADLGTYFLVGPASTVSAGFINLVAGKYTCMKFTRGDKRILVPALHSYTSKVLRGKICLLEVPGLTGSSTEVSDSKLLCLVQYTYFQALSKGFKPKGIIVTEATLQNRLEIFRSLDRLCSLFGSKCTSSSVVLARWMQIKSKEDEDNENLIFGKCESLGIPYVKWTNSIDLLSKEDAEIQLSNLISALNKMKPFYETWMTELEEEIKLAPEVVENRDPNVYSDDELDLEEMQNKLRSVSYVGTSLYYEQRKLSRSGIINAARRSFGLEYDRID